VRQALASLRYAPVGQAHVAYQVFGDGPVDIVYDGGWYSSIGASWGSLAEDHQRVVA
jgi:hypothetical protein